MAVMYAYFDSTQKAYMAAVGQAGILIFVAQKALYGLPRSQNVLKHAEHSND